MNHFQNKLLIQKQLLIIFLFYLFQYKLSCEQCSLFQFYKSKLRIYKATKMEHVEVQTKFTPLYNANNNENQYYAPFMVKSKRFKQSKQKSQIPAIGSYNLPSCFQRKKSPFQDKMDRLLLEAQKKKQQMSMFKSSCNRFDKIYKQVPGPASYNLFKDANEKQPHQLKKSLINDKKIKDITKTCPSIPFKDNKYGYAVAEGKFNTIQKGLDQLQLQKQSRKQYVQTLKGQMNFRRQNQSFSNSQIDFKKKLYETTQKIVAKENLSPSLSQKSFNLLKKPKIQHLYHSKGVPVSVNYKLLGPGQYDIKSKDFERNLKNQKFQFFGSSQVRFKNKFEIQNKGYTIIEMLSQNKRLERKEKRSPLKHKTAKSIEKTENKVVQYPGPGQYDPKHQNKTIGRGNTFFPQSERFKQMYPEIKSEDIQNIDQVNELQRKNTYNGSLKKDRFKPMQKVYQPVQSSQIKGILSENKKALNHISGLSKQMGFEIQEINSWSRQQKRNKTTKKGYIKELKEQLQMISYTPQAEDQMKNKIKLMKQRMK